MSLGRLQQNSALMVDGKLKFPVAQMGSNVGYEH